MIAVDTNLLVYAHRRDSSFHEPAAAAIRDLAESRAPWAIPWPCIHEFLAIVTHPRIYRPPTKLPAALNQVHAWMESPSLVLLAEAPGYAQRLSETLAQAKATGAKVHDGRIAALCLHHGVSSLWSADRDFSRFPSLRVENPMMG